MRYPWAAPWAEELTVNNESEMEVGFLLLAVSATKMPLCDDAKLRAMGESPHADQQRMMKDELCCALALGIGKVGKEYTCQALPLHL